MMLMLQLRVGGTSSRFTEPVGGRCLICHLTVLVMCNSLKYSCQQSYPEQGSSLRVRHNICPAPSTATNAMPLVTGFRTLYQL